MSWLDNLGSGFPAMEFPAGETVTRERRRPVVDPYDPSNVTPGSWNDPLDIITLESCYIDSASSSSGADATREPVATTKTLYCTDASVDVKAGDRVRRGNDLFYVRERTEADVNPWTSWQPLVAIPLSMTEG